MKYLLVIFSFFLAFAVNADTESVIIYTEDNPPFIFVNEEGRVDGISTRQVVTLMEETGLNYEIRLVSWVRAMRNAQLLDNALIYSLVRTDEREAKFDWLAHLTVAKYYLYAHKRLKEPVTLKDIRAGKYKAVCPVQSVFCPVLEGFGFPREKLHRISFMEFIEQFKLVESGRVDFFLNSAMTYPYLVEKDKSPYPKDTFKRIEGISYDYNAYLAAGSQVKESVRRYIADTYKEMRAEGRIAPYDLETWAPAAQEIAK